MKKVSIGFTVIAVIFWLVSISAYAFPVYDNSAPLTGSRLESSGIVTTSPWAGVALTQQINWEITNIEGGNWNYKYTFINFVNPGIKYFILDLTDDAVNPGDPNSVTNLSTSSGIIGFGTFVMDSISMNIVGVKFDFGDGVTSDNWWLSFDSNRAPVYGDFFIKGIPPPLGESTSGVGVAAYNSGISDHDLNNVQGFIARPNSAVPEPATMLLLGSGLLGLAGFARRRFHKK